MGHDAPAVRTSLAEKGFLLFVAAELIGDGNRNADGGRRRNQLVPGCGNLRMQRSNRRCFYRLPRLQPRQTCRPLLIDQRNARCDQQQQKRVQSRSCPGGGQTRRR